MGNQKQRIGSPNLEKPEGASLEKKKNKKKKHTF